MRVLLLPLLLIAGCASFGPSPEHHRCVSHCQRENDRCLVSAQTGGQVQWCEDATTNCVRACPP